LSINTVAICAEDELRDIMNEYDGLEKMLSVKVDIMTWQ
jgi:hypothetical protein